ncbi:type II toxin-antitoxin system VapC family toxin [Thermosulfurimonas marina]|uniref:Type II toxin-antitoxin system VapC family toxin n=1 Tax=Thermosulfurimonas marina TaxID=2047767 RepID=A0A6H1WSV6_9BACT|nr:type II toxin-antitoxin system VapC family toxin [Thermosulfurimonas marina]QJA06305.1 type II toxin-antitoxin system VapC family toxin [Thermosulfurimonas marina]
MSTINFGEAFYMLIKKGFREEAYTLWNKRDQLPLKFISPTWKRIKLAAEIKAVYPLSYADAFCAALALEMEAPVLAGDPEFKKVNGLELIWIP